MDRCTIQVKRCPTCPVQSNMHAGPDCRDMGLFNYNNTTLLTHTLLNSFCGYTVVQEGTFHAWHDYSQTIYDSHRSRKRLLGVERFIVAWFGFIELQDLGDSFFCDICRDGNIFIVDGVTISYQKRRITGKVKPPTVVDQDAPERPWVRPLDKTRVVQLVSDRNQRETARKMLKWCRRGTGSVVKWKKKRAARVAPGSSRFAALDLASDDEVQESEAEGDDYARSDVKEMAMKLHSTNAIVGKWFRRWVKRGSGTLEEVTRASPWRRLLKQVRSGFICDHGSETDELHRYVRRSQCYSLSAIGRL